MFVQPFSYGYLPKTRECPIISASDKTVSMIAKLAIDLSLLRGLLYN